MSIDQPAAGQAKSLGYTEDQLRPILDAIRAARAGDLSVTLPTSQGGILGEIGREFNGLMDINLTIAGELTRVARDLGTDGRFGSFPEVPEALGTWKDLVDNIYFMAANLTTQVRNIAKVVTAVANGDLSQKVSLEAKGEVAALADTINGMTETLGTFAGEVTRVAREVGTEGKLGGQVEVLGVSGTWKDLTDSLNCLAGNLTNQIRNIAFITSLVANGDFSRRVTVASNGEIAELKESINTMLDQLATFNAEATQVVRELGTEGRFGGQIEVKDASGEWKELIGGINTMSANLTTQLRSISKVATAAAQGDPLMTIVTDAQGEMRVLKDAVNAIVEQLRSAASDKA